MTRQFMVRILRDTDDDYADVVVDAETEFSAKCFLDAIERQEECRVERALRIVSGSDFRGEPPALASAVVRGANLGGRA